MTEAAFIQLDQVGKTYRTRTGPVHAVAQASFGVRQGEFVSPIEGPRSDNGIIFQDATLLPWKSVIDNVLFPIDILKRPRADYEARALELIARVGLRGFERKKPHELSGGMRQRVAICRALIHDPPVLLMDEPFSALDAITRDQMNIVLAEMLETYNKTVLFVTHSIREAVYLSDRVLVMSGRPSTITLDLSIDFPRPRSPDIEDAPRFRELVRELRESIEHAHEATAAQH